MVPWIMDQFIFQAMQSPSLIFGVLILYASIPKMASFFSMPKTILNLLSTRSFISRDFSQRKLLKRLVETRETTLVMLV